MRDLPDIDLIRQGNRLVTRVGGASPTRVISRQVAQILLTVAPASAKSLSDISWSAATTSS